MTPRDRLVLDDYGRVKDAACNACGSYHIAPPDATGGAYCTDCGSGDVDLPEPLTPEADHAA